MRSWGVCVAKLPKKIAGVKTPIALAALALLVGVLYLRHRAAAGATSNAGPAASTFDSGLGSGGSGAVSTPTDNGLGSTAVGTDGTQNVALWDTLLSAYAISAQSNSDLAAHAGSYTNYTTTTNFSSTPSTWNAGVTVPNGFVQPPVAWGGTPSPVLPPVSSLHLPGGSTGYGPVITDAHTIAGTSRAKLA